MTLTEAITEETRRYLFECRATVYHREGGSVLLERHHRRLARIHYRTLLRLRHRELTHHEVVCVMTPTVRAYGAVSA